MDRELDEEPERLFKEWSLHLSAAQRGNSLHHSINEKG